MSTTHATTPEASTWRLFLTKLRSVFLWLGLPLIALILIPIAVVLVQDGLPTH